MKLANYPKAEIAAKAIADMEVIDRCEGNLEQASSYIGTPFQA